MIGLVRRQTAPKLATNQSLRTEKKELRSDREIRGKNLSRKKFFFVHLLTQERTTRHEIRGGALRAAAAAVGEGGEERPVGGARAAVPVEERGPMGFSRVGGSSTSLCLGILALL